MKKEHLLNLLGGLEIPAESIDLLHREINNFATELKNKAVEEVKITMAQENTTQTSKPTGEDEIVDNKLVEEMRQELNTFREERKSFAMDKKLTDLGVTPEMLEFVKFKTNGVENIEEFVTGLKETNPMYFGVQGKGVELPVKPQGATSNTSEDEFLGNLGLTAQDL
jgi:hypothetical protein